MRLAYERLKLLKRLNQSLLCFFFTFFLGVFFEEDSSPILIEVFVNQESVRDNPEAPEENKGCASVVTRHEPDAEKSDVEEVEELLNGVHQISLR